MKYGINYSEWSISIIARRTTCNKRTTKFTEQGNWWENVSIVNEVIFNCINVHTSSSLGSNKLWIYQLSLMHFIINEI